MHELDWHDPPPSTPPPENMSSGSSTTMPIAIASCDPSSCACCQGEYDGIGDLDVAPKGGWLLVSVLTKSSCKSGSAGRWRCCLVQYHPTSPYMQSIPLLYRPPKCKSLTKVRNPGV